jgi:P4 family phage/plasmid primase-like protien
VSSDDFSGVDREALGRMAAALPTADEVIRDWARLHAADEGVERDLHVVTEAEALGGNVDENIAMLERALAEALEGNGDGSKPAPKIQHLTDIGNGQRFAAMHAGKVVYMPSRGWLAYEAACGAWRPNERAVARLAKATALSWYATAAGCEDGDVRSPVLKHARASESAQKIAATLKMAESELAFEAEPQDFDAHPFLLNTPTCVVDLRNGERLPHDPELRFTQVAGASYEPEAECPLWLAHLERIFAGDAELIGFLQRFFGYCLTGRTGEQVICIFHGNGANGKSVTTETLRAVLGDYAASVDPRSLAISRHDGPRTDLARLAGARFVTAAESSADTQLDEALVKAATGGEPLTVRHLYKDPFEYVPQFKVVLSTNHKPEITGTDLGIWRRVRLVPFDVTIPEREQDRDLPTKLQTELPGILSWMVRGCIVWQEKGLEAPAAVLEATAGYRAEQDVVGRFLGECSTPDRDAAVAVRLVYQAYKVWAGHAGETALTEQRFRTALREHGVRLDGLESRTNRLLCWGIRLATFLNEDDVEGSPT